MKRIKKLSATTLLIFGLSLSLVDCSSPVESAPLNNSSDQLLYSVLDQTSTEDLSTTERDGLIYMREEEKLARDVYLVLNGQWNVRIFNNISKAEQRHTDAIKYLLDRYQIDDPVTNNEIGSFTNQNLLKLYNDLTAQGKTSLAEALKVGAAIEEIDILDLQKDIAAADNEDIKLVYNNLMEGSYNHLRAFVRNLSAQGISYTPQYLSDEVYANIINN